MAGGGSNIEYTQSPEQQAMLRMFMPMLQGMSNYAMGNMSPGLNTFQPPQRGGWEGRYSPGAMDALGYAPGMLGNQGGSSGGGGFGGPGGGYPMSNNRSGEYPADYSDAMGQWGNYSGKFGERTGYGRDWAVPGAWADEDDYNYGMGNSYSTAPGMPWGTSGSGADWYY